MNFLNGVDGPSHVQGHTLDLILSHGISVFDTTICELNFSDHKPIIFSVPLVSQSIPMHEPVHWSRTLNSTSITNFSQMYKNICDSEFLDSSLPNIDLDEHFNRFNSTCISVLDSVSPLKPKRQKRKN